MEHQGFSFFSVEGDTHPIGSMLDDEQSLFSAFTQPELGRNSARSGRSILVLYKAEAEAKGRDLDLSCGGFSRSFCPEPDSVLNLIKMAISI